MKHECLVEKLNIRSNNINLIRFVAALMVIFSHAFYVAEAGEDPLSILTNNQVNIGGISVAIFFFISGLYVSKSLHTSCNNIHEYLKKRCERIFPQLWVVVVFSTFVIGGICTTNKGISYFANKNTYLYLLNCLLIPVHNLPGVFENSIYVSTVNGPLWTMPVEFFGYVLIAMVFLLSNLFKRKQFFFRFIYIVGYVGCVVLMLVFSYVMKNQFLLTVVRAFCFFIIGVLYYYFETYIRYSRVLYLFCVVAVIVLVKLPFYNFVLLIALPYIVVSTALFVKQITFSWDVWMCSYEMYLLGWPIQQIITMINGGKMSAYANFMLTVPFDVALGYVLYRVINKIQKKKKGDERAEN